MSETRVSWHSINPSAPFLVNRGDLGLQDYRNWVASGAYSAHLFDGSLLQITYDVSGGDISGHRLAYIPCPYRLDPDMVYQDPLLDVVDIHVATEPANMLLRSAVRFDYDPENAKPGHPSSHMTINASSCRIACAAPLHIGRFIDFIFRHFYADIWSGHTDYFSRGAHREIGARTIIEEDRYGPHIWWE
ncbi:DUF2290 domain-containing protein [Streptomyces sp. MBT53]|uniref:DUF2290 domain-containing protein n=1 Tax=Streptomyces sp. MBT53 TaxID=1488384 RepID=UPI001913D03A|nr:DUF2290 domain-containing protein [Streptomyces sp. MBT53]MBK6013779.1 DUF2290 domain-containing protein [Streptomyces sp. MBT53]